MVYNAQGNTEPDYSQYYDVVNPYYQQLFGRQAASPGLNYWASLLADPNSGVNEQNLRDFLLANASEADRNYYNYNAGFNAQDYYDVLNPYYQELFGRDVGESGLDFFGRQLANTADTVDASNIRDAIIAAAQGSDLDYYNQTFGGGGRNEPPVTNDVVDNGDGTVTDPVTGQTYTYNNYFFGTEGLNQIMRDFGYLSPGAQGQQLTEYSGGDIADPQTTFTPLSAKGGANPPPANATYGKGGNAGKGGPQ